MLLLRAEKVSCLLFCLLLGCQQTAPPASTPSTPAVIPAATTAVKVEPADDARPLCKQLDAFDNKAAKYTLSPQGHITAIDVIDGAQMTPELVTLIAQQPELTSIKISNFRDLNHEMVSEWKGLTKLTVLWVRGCVIKDETLEMIADAFPNLVELDVSSNSNLTDAAFRHIAKLTSLQRLFAIQNRFSDIGARNVRKLTQLQVLDLRGNVEVGAMTMEAIATLPELRVLKHRGGVDDSGIEALVASPKLDSLLVQDFPITNDSGQFFRQIPALTQLEIFRCVQFSSPGVLELAGMPIKRLLLRDLASVDDSAMEVFKDLPQLERLFLHELPSVSDAGLANLSALASLRQLDVWELPRFGDATVEVLSKLPKLEEISIRSCGVTDAAVETLVAMKQRKTLKKVELLNNTSVSPEALQKLK